MFVTMQQSNWKDSLEEIKEHVQRMNKEKETIISRDYNQCIGGNVIQKNYREIGVQDVLSK